MSTPSDEELLLRLRALKEQQKHSEGLSDRFGDPQFDQHASKLAAEIAQMPPHILHAEEIADKLQWLSYSVEDYLIARTAQFLPDVEDLWATIEALPQRTTQETPAEKSVLRWLGELRTLGASEESIKTAVLRSASLDSYKDPRAPRWSTNSGMGATPRHDYQQALRQHLRDYLQKGIAPADRNSLQTSSDLVRRINQWRREAQSAEESDSDSFMTRFYQQAILSAIAVLQKLDISDADIDALVAEAYDPRSLRR
jgi:hypothetical protein